MRDLSLPLLLAGGITFGVAIAFLLTGVLSGAPSYTPAIPTPFIDRSAPCPGGEAMRAFATCMSREGHPCIVNERLCKVHCRNNARAAAARCGRPDYS
jgi:hypothetical protein